MDNVVLVYLDQCVISRFLSPSDADGWRAVHALLTRGVDAGTMVCPHSLEHLIETAAMPHGDAVAADLVLRRLSAGWSLRMEPDLIAAQITHYIRHKSAERSYALEETRFKPLSNLRTYTVLRERKAHLDEYNVRAMTPQNDLNEVLRNVRRADRSVLRVLARLCNESYTRRFLADLEPSLVDGRAHVVFREDARHIPTDFSFITARLIEDHGFGLHELQALATQLGQTGVVFVPFYFAKVSLEACHRWKQKRRDHGDQYDITRLSCALPVVDLIVTDSSAASAIRDVGLDQLFGTQVFSTKDAERKGIVEALQAFANKRGSQAQGPGD